MKVRKWLYHEGFGYRKNVKNLPGKPDIVLKKYKTAIFINGCFWHRHQGCKYATTPKTRTEFWNEKFQKNIANDTKHTEQLEQPGYKVVVIWECEINHHFDETMQKLKAELLSQLEKSD